MKFGFDQPRKTPLFQGKKISGKEFLSNLDSKIQEKIALAKENALSKEEYEHINAEERRLESVQNNRELTEQEIEYFFPLRQKMNNATIEVETIPEARRVMELLGFNHESLIDTLAHENAHGNRAEELEAEHLGYKFLLIKNNAGFIVQPIANLYIPDEWDQERQKAVNSEMTWAPEDYGNKISDDDRKDLEDLYKEE